MSGGVPNAYHIGSIFVCSCTVAKELNQDILLHTDNWYIKYHTKLDECVAYQYIVLMQKNISTYGMYHMIIP